MKDELLPKWGPRLYNVLQKINQILKTFVDCEFITQGIRYYNFGKEDATESKFGVLNKS